jgi:hypothetical protein
MHLSFHYLIKCMYSAAIALQSRSNVLHLIYLSNFISKFTIRLIFLLISEYLLTSICFGSSIMLFIDYFSTLFTSKMQFSYFLSLY